MDGHDFTIPSPKRQRTNSPDERPSTLTILPEDTSNPHSNEVPQTLLAKDGDEPAATTVEADQNEILDALMMHVEAEATTPTPPPSNPAAASRTIESSDDAKLTTPSGEENVPPKVEIENQLEYQSMSHVSEAAVVAQTSEIISTQVGEAQAQLNKESPPTEQEHPRIEITETQTAALQVEGIPPTEAIEPVDEEGHPEWEVDSSPYESSTDSDSTDSSDEDSDDDDDEDADGDYAMLDPEEAARILMQGDAGSDDEGDKSKGRGEGSGLKTANEQMEDVPPVPDIQVTEDMVIEELGSIEAVVENNVLVKGKVSGEYRVLESGSLLCLASRTVVGVVAETLGRVEQPLYTMRFRTEQEIVDRGLSQKNMAIYYVPQHSTFVFTQPLKAFKGSDASNFHDEEVGDDEMEFSDDELEAEHKRQLKLKRQGRTGDTGKGRASGRGGRGGQRGGYNPSPLSTETNGSAYGNGSLEMNYDDLEEGEEGYTPLARPSNLHEMMNTGSAMESMNPSHMPPPPFGDRGRGRGHRRGGRGQDRGGRGGRGRGNFRGNYNDHRGGSLQQNHSTQPQYSNPYPNQYSPQGQFSYSQPPPAPTITPQNPSYPYSTITSPISPLPKQQFNFGVGFHGPQSFSPTFPQQQWNQQLPGGFAPQFNSPAVMQFAQQFQQAQQQQNQQRSSGWQVNQAAAAEVQRQLEEMRRQQGGGQ